MIILLYHRVREGDLEIDLPVCSFEAQLRLIAESQTVLSIEDALNVPESGGVIVTFDDGDRSFFENALPLLARYKIPATLYLTTGIVGDSEGDRKPLSWGDVADAASTGLITVGAHTHSHADLLRASPREAHMEMARSKGLIEDHLNSACDHFSYPYAIGSPWADDAARELFRTAARDAWQINRGGEMDPHRLGRVPVLKSDGRLFFRAKLNGYLNGEAFLYRLLRRGPWRTEAMQTGSL